MNNRGWTRSESPFHKGERALQAMAGVLAQVDAQGRRMICEYLIEQHRQFFAQLSYVFIGSIDPSGDLWTSVLIGTPGFLSTPDEYTLRVPTQLLPGDPLAHLLSLGPDMLGCDVGVMGIVLATRRRNRISGTVSRLDATGFDIRVSQSFGNCPQYIQSREIVDEPPILDPTALDAEVSPQVFEMTSLSESAHSLITAADTFFISTAYQARSAGRPALAGGTSGVDVSHRGGKPGFVGVDGNTLTIPDYAGNNHFSTLGNVLLNPKAGLLFIDFESGGLLYLTGTAEVIWEGPEVAEHEWAHRLLRFQVVRGYFVKGSLPLRWSAPEFSPFLR
ncbi:MAG: pyridoxamine 5'-phosphate oxidase family protein [Cyanobacteria bacterium J06598_3]